MDRFSERGTPCEQALLRAARGRRAPDEARARALGALTAAGTVSAMSAATMSAQGAAVIKAGLGGSSVAKLLIVGASIAAIGAAASVSMSREAPSPRDVSATAAPTAIASSPASAETSRDASTFIAPTPAPTATTSPAASSVTTASRVVSPPARVTDARVTADHGPALRDEIALLGQARGSLGAGDSTAALRALDTFEARFPRASLAEEARVLRIEALSAAGRRAEAETLAAPYLQARVSSPYASRVQNLLSAQQGSNSASRPIHHRGNEP